MSKRMKGSLPYLQVLVKSKPKLRKLLINNVPEEVITAICECSLNLLKGVVPLTPGSKATFGTAQDTSPRFESIRECRESERGRTLNQKGGGLLIGPFAACSKQCLVVY